VMQPLLANPALKPGRPDILSAYAHFLETLAIRRSTQLFRLRTGDDVKQRLSFHNTGPNQIPGLIVMSVADADGRVDRSHSLLVVVLNADKATQSFTIPALAGKTLKLHPLQKLSVDPATRASSYASGTGGFSVPGRTAAVFWANRPATEQIALLIQDLDALVTAGKLSGGRGTALKAKLQAAQQQAQMEHATPAANQLSAFLNQVEVFAGQGFLSQEDAEALNANALRAIAQLYL
jgi:hypothetical protein